MYLFLLGRPYNFPSALPPENHVTGLRDGLMKKREILFVLLILSLAYAFIIIRNAWISDDAYITFRTIENFVSGNGLVYNPGVRVQAFTHPLWFFVLSTAYSILVKLVGISWESGLHFLTLFLSIILSCATFFLILRRIAGNNFISLCLCASPLLLSRAFIDYSTSGLENPLTHFLLALFLWKFLEESPDTLVLGFLAGLITLNRLDMFLIVAPALGYILFTKRTRLWKNVLYILIGFLPVILWELFSLYYYGFLFPNTAYAKLNTGISTKLLVEQGVDYFINSLNWDPITLFAIACASIMVVFQREKKRLFLLSGLILYLAYIIYIGGDFMSGRFLSAAVVVSAVLLAYSRFVITPRYQMVGLAALVVFGVFSSRSTLNNPYLPELLDDPYGKSDANGITDERLWYFDEYGLLTRGVRKSDVGSPYAGNRWVYSGTKRIVFVNTLGIKGYMAGPNTSFVDEYALADPLLARLPVYDPVFWRIGHFSRVLPKGYMETLEEGTIQISDPNLAKYYEKLSFIITGPLWNWDRIVEIWKFNTGQYDYLVNAYVATGN
jgi:arabinofuranosyltransferase